MYTTARKNGYTNNKDVRFSKIEGIEIENFRSVKNKKITLGDNITLISGKNGTMKSCFLGLIAHPFSSPNDARDIHNHPLKTSMKDVFKLSSETDREKYNYNIKALTNKNEMILEPVEVYLRPNDIKPRHRVTVGEDHSPGLGNFLLNTSYVNFRRLFPIIFTSAEEQEMDEKDFTCNDRKFISDGYRKILQKDSYKKIKPVTDKNDKDTFGPADSYYDFSTISSGEDNLGNILVKMLAFQKFKRNDNCLEGIFCIDEIEASLHPIAQEKLFDFLLNWSIENKVQIVATTHSLYLIQYAIQKQKIINNKSKIALNMISTAFVDDNNYNIILNPTYNQAYKELTYKDIDDLENEYKINVIMEDKMASYYFNKIFNRNKVKKYINIYTELGVGVGGNSSGSLNSLVKNGGKLLKDCIVLYDADIDISKVKSNGVDFSKLPDENGLPIEKMIAYYIHSLKGGHEFFVKMKKEKLKFDSEFADCNIVFPENIDGLKKLKIDKFKKWASLDTKSFNKYIDFYVVNNKEMFEPFRNEFIKLVNTKLERKSLPIIK